MIVVRDLQIIVGCRQRSIESGIESDQTILSLIETMQCNLGWDSHVSLVVRPFWMSEACLSMLVEAQIVVCERLLTMTTLLNMVLAVCGYCLKFKINSLF